MMVTRDRGPFAAARAGASRVLLTILVVALIAALSLVAILSTHNQGGQTTGSTQSQGVLVSLGQTPRTLGPGIEMNYTLSINPRAGSIGNATVSAVPPKGLTVRVDPSNVVLGQASTAVDVSVIAAYNITAGSYQVGFNVAWEGGSYNIIYRFDVVPHLVLLLGGTTGPGGFFPQSIHARPGETVTWMSLDAGSDEYGGLRSVEVVELNVSSPTLTLYSTWSYSFAVAGTYHIEDPLNHILVAEATVVVE